jgi:uncharacterized protein YdhG (YjbR/CyaY superfamily)
MAERTKFETPDEYIKSFPKEVQTILKTVRTAIQKVVPEAEEVISYNVPAFKYHGWVFYYSAYTNHFSLSCPPPFAAFGKFKKELSRYKQSKSAVQFPLDEPVPVKLISALAKFNAEFNEKSNTLKPKKKAKR